MLLEPELSLITLTLIVLACSLVSALLRSRKLASTLLSLVALMLVTMLLVTQKGRTITVNGLPLLSFDKHSIAMLVLLLISSSLIIALLWREIDNAVAPLIPWTMYASIMIALSINPAILILGLELGALSITGTYLSHKGSEESAVKYFFTSILAGALIIAGTALLISNHVYSFTGISTATPSLIFGLTFLITGLALEVGLAPFHPWLPDVAANAPVLGITLAILLVDAPTLYVFFRLISAAKAMGQILAWILAILAAASMAIGELSALVQTSIRRMLGFSMVSDAGYTLLLGVACALSGILSFNVVIYFITSSNMALALALASARDKETIGPIVPALLSLMGLPPFYGFTAKLSVITFFARIGYPWMAVIASFFFLVAAAYVMRYLMTLSRDSVLKGYNIFSLIYVAILLLLGLYPGIINLVG